MDPEQRKGGEANAKHDLYSLGIVWYQLLVGDVTREFHGGWDDELASEFKVPRSHIDIIKQCVGWIKNRPANGGELLKLLNELSAPRLVPVTVKEFEEPQSDDDFPQPKPDDYYDGDASGGDSKHPMYAYLVGGTPKGTTVHILVKVHDWAAKAVYLYDLVTGSGPKHIAGSNEPQMVAQWMERAKRDGHQIPHTGRMSFKKAHAWIQYAKAEAARRHLTVAKSPS